MSKRIGIPGWMTGEHSFGVSASYIAFIHKFGKPVFITPYDVEDPPEVDMVLAPGGADILPSTYDAVPGFDTLKPNVMLEHFDAKILPQYIKKETPIFGICRGMQRIWVHYGGQLEQHNAWHDQSKNQFDQCHELWFPPEFQHYNKMIKKVTSRHHQCADASVYVPDELEVIAYAKETNSTYWEEIVEIFRHKTLPIFCVQFHPEDHDYTDKLCSSIISEFLNI